MSRFCVQVETMLSFEKMEGLGNDFLVIDARGRSVQITAEAARRLCHRRTGVGADGVLTVYPPSGRGDLRMHIFNADGSVAEMCGNGLRCVMWWARSGESGRVRVETDAGLRTGEVVSGQVRVGMGPARKLGPPLAVDADLGLGSPISMGNPHLVVFPGVGSRDELMELARREGPRHVAHPAFPGEVNVGFAWLSQPDRLELVVYERGSGLTEACGTGAAAAAAAAQDRGLVPSGRPLTVVLPGGPLVVELGEAPAGSDVVEEVTITGPARWVFRGETSI